MGYSVQPSRAVAAAASASLGAIRLRGQPKSRANTAGPKSEVEAESKPQAKENPRSDVSPQLLKRVHELYEELGREEVEAVQEWENAKQGLQKNDSRK